MFKILSYVKNEKLSYEITREIDKELFQISVNSNINNYDYYNNIMRSNADIVFIDTLGLNGEYVLLDRLVQTKKIIIYISDKMEFGYLYNLMQESNFYVISNKNINALNDLLRLMIREYNKVRVLEERVRKYQEKEIEEKLVRKAKLKLMKEYNMEENKAHHFIIDKAMKERKTKKEIASDILEN